MIPRTVLMAQEVAAQFTPTQLEDYGNIILNGYPFSFPSVSTAGAVGAIDAVTIGGAGTGYTDGTYSNIYLSSPSGGNFAYADVTVSGGSVTGATVTTGGKQFTVNDNIYLGNLPGAGAGTAAYLTVTSVNQIGVSPALKGWTTNYQEYYTQLQPNGYGVNPGDPTMFEYVVHSFTPVTGGIQTIGGNGNWISGGSNYTPGIYIGVALTGGSGAGAIGDIVVQDASPGVGPITAYTQLSGGANYGYGIFAANNPAYSVTGVGVGAKFNTATNLGPPGDLSVIALTDPGQGYAVGDTLEFVGGSPNATVQVTSVGVNGTVTSITITTPGTGYIQGEAVSAAIPGGSGFYAPISAIIPTPGTGSQPRWAQPPRRFFQNQAADFTPPTANQQAIQYSFMYPVADNPVPPPIDTL